MEHANVLNSGNGRADCTIDFDRLLTPTPFPSGFKREKPTAFRFQPYSRKIRRRLDIYTPILYDLWVAVEWDPSIRMFNERVEPISVGCTNGKVFKFTPRMVTMTKDGECVVHTLSSTESEAGINDSESVENWATKHRIICKVWTPEEIRLNLVEIENRKQLYAYIGSPETVISPACREKVFVVLRRYRKTTLDDLVASVADMSAEQVIQIVAEQIMQGNLYTDIHKHQFDWSTEVSCFHEFT